MKLKGKIISLVSLFLICAMAWFVLKTKDRIPFYGNYGVEVPSDFQIMGIDVSHHQGDIYWEEVDKMSVDGDSLSFAIIKATEGLTFRDDKTAQNAIGAKETDLDIGYYHYFHPSVSAREQAMFFLEAISDLSGTLKPVLDVEITGGLSNQQLNDSVLVFLTKVEEEAGVRPIIYSYESFYRDYFQSALQEKELFWIASYNKTCDLILEEQVICWQFTDKGTVSGISTKVDLNLVKKGEFEKMKR